MIVDAATRGESNSANLVLQRRAKPFHAEAKKLFRIRRSGPHCLYTGAGLVLLSQRDGGRLLDIYSKIEAQIAERNVIRQAAQLPVLDCREIDRLRSARAYRVFEAVFASRRHRFPEISIGVGGWFSRYGRWAQARGQVRQELVRGEHLQDVLFALGFGPTADDHDYDHDDHGHDRRHERRYILADRSAPLATDDLASVLVEYGWKQVGGSWALWNIHTGDILEIESDSAETSLRHMSRR
jgi:hypothetical protein